MVWGTPAMGLTALETDKKDEIHSAPEGCPWAFTGGACSTFAAAFTGFYRLLQSHFFTDFYRLFWCPVTWWLWPRLFGRKQVCPHPHAQPTTQHAFSMCSAGCNGHVQATPTAAYVAAHLRCCPFTGGFYRQLYSALYSTFYSFHRHP